MTTNFAFFSLLVSCIVGVSACLFSIARAYPTYYEELNSPPLFWNGFKQQQFVLGHVLWFRYWKKVGGVTRALCVVLTVLSWLFLISAIMFFAKLLH